MNPSLVALYGPVRGATFHWKEPALTIGRDASNSVSLPDSLVSRNHCVIQCEEGKFVIHDLNSRNGLYINGLPVKTRVLQHGDQVEIGDSLFLFLLQEIQRTPSREEFEDRAENLPQFTTELRFHEAIYLKPEKLPGSRPLTRRLERDLAFLLRISTAFHSYQTVQEWTDQLLTMLLEAVPADRALIIPAEDSAMDPFAAAGAVKNSGREIFPVSRSLTAKVKSEGIAVLCSDLQNDPNFRTESIVRRRIQSLICVPLSAQGQLLGAIYLDTSNEGIRFDEEHLQLITAIAGIASLALKNLLHTRWLEEEKDRLQTEIADTLVGESHALKKVHELIAKVAPTDSTVMICGESGTGKELVARAIHSASLRKNKPFIAINCAVLSETLFESEIFGHEKGSFTGAVAQQRGKLETAEGGTVFLDEISEIPPAIQAKLLRVIQYREFERIGGLRPIRCNVRWIAASNRNLEEAIRADKFRQDLFYRLNVLNITTPPLRERREDIPLLANYFLGKYSKKLRRKVKGISTAAQQALLAYDWPGNVRELENAIEHAVVLGSGELVQIEDLPERLLELEVPSNTLPTGYHTAMRETKKQLVLNALQQANGNFTGAAKLLGVHPTYLHRLMHNLNLKRPKSQSE